jgi:hemolysin activation/secretion protein
MTTITPYWFMEYGYGVQNATVGNDQWAEMSDVGVGLTFNWKGGLSSKISVAKPTSSRISYNDENVTATRLYIEFIWQID